MKEIKSTVLTIFVIAFAACEPAPGVEYDNGGNGGNGGSNPLSAITEVAGTVQSNEFDGVYSYTVTSAGNAYFTMDGAVLNKGEGRSGIASADITPNGGRVSLVIFGKELSSFTNFDTRFHGICGYLNGTVTSGAHTIATMLPAWSNTAAQVTAANSPFTSGGTFSGGTLKFTVKYEVQENNSCDVEFILSKGTTESKLTVNISAANFAQMGTDLAFRVTDNAAANGAVISNVSYESL